MGQVIEVERKSSILSRPALPCLSKYHTINLAAGCPYECRYCYAQDFRSYPGRGKVKFYANSLERLRRELPRKRKKPELVYFSTSCEPFMPHPPILDELFGTMELLLAHGVSVLISTKSRVPDRFLDLFSRHKDLVHVQIGLTTTDDQVRRLIEPNAAPVEQRLETLGELIERGIRTEVRIDPLIPELTDTDASFTDLCQAVSDRGARTGAVSYLFLRRANVSRMNVEFGAWSFSDMAERLYTGTIDQYCGSGTVRAPSSAYRGDRYEWFKETAADHDIQLRLCGCKNPDLTHDCCHPELPRGNDGAQKTLF
jgi:DNA repair photolyase